MYFDIRDSIIYENPETGLVAICKPSGIDTYSLAGLVRDYYHGQNHANAPPEQAQRGTKRAKASKFQMHAVHRLDWGTSGCIVLGNTPSIRRSLCKTIKHGHAIKQYIAIVDGVPADQRGLIDRPLTTERGAGKPMRTFVRPDGKPSQTEYQILATDGMQSLLYLRPLTGRTHQLRVHCASILGTPIHNDEAYNPNGERAMPMCLHAWKIALPGTTMREDLELQAPIPPYMRKIMATMEPVSEAARAIL